LANKTDLVTGPDEGKSLSLGGLGVIYKVLPEDVGGAFAVVEHPIQPGRLVRPHTHAKEDEISYVIEGEIGVRIGDREFIARQGAWVFKPRGVQHTFWNASDKQARIIEIITPGAMAHYFEELAEILNVRGPPDLEKLAELHTKYEQSYSTEWIPALKEKYNLKLVGDP
jgi:quercetin dioxygenase-like cupin family protein